MSTHIQAALYTTNPYTIKDYKLNIMAMPEVHE